MLHAVPELLDALEAKLVRGEDPSKLLAGIRWSEMIGWPLDVTGARALKRRIDSLRCLIASLQAPIRATLLAVTDSGNYGRDGAPAEGAFLAGRLRERA